MSLLGGVDEHPRVEVAPQLVVAEARLVRARARARARVRVRVRG